LLFDVDGQSIDIEKPAVVADEVIRGYSGPGLAEGYQVGYNADDEDKRQYYVRRYA